MPKKARRVKSAACRTRTCNPQLRRLMLYPIELRLQQISRLSILCRWESHFNALKVLSALRAGHALEPAKPQAESDLYLAYSTVRTSRRTVTLISPGYCMSVSIFF